MDYLVILFTKLIGYVTGLLGGGTNLPGQIALRCRPGILKRLVKGYRVILVTGTNGKTTTTAMLQNILRKTGKRAVSSASGANMKGGVVSCLLRNFPLFKKVDGDFAVLEVDEAYMRHITRDIEPEVIAITNLFPDQMDRYGEVDKTLALIEEACKIVPGATLVLNGDEPLLGSFLPEHKRFFYGFSVPIREGETLGMADTFCKKCQKPFSYDYVTFSHLGAYRCDGCGAERPTLDLAVDGVQSISEESSCVTVNSVPISIMQAGAYNIYNALCAAACAKALRVSQEAVTEGLAGQKSKFGRQETVQVGKASVRIILVKNPVGAEEAIASVLPDKEEVSLGVLLNDNVGDGKDVSWIYDVEFERLGKMHIKEVFTGGTRGYDMAIRLQTAGFEAPSVFEETEAVVSALSRMEGKVYLFVTYSAMIGVRKLLHKKGYIKKLWF